VAGRSRSVLSVSIYGNSAFGADVCATRSAKRIVLRSMSAIFLLICPASGVLSFFA
jgi:hypothetical protein